MFSSFQSLVDTLVGYVGLLTVLLMFVGVAIYFYGIAAKTFSLQRGEARTQLTQYMGWGLVVIFVMFSIWGILLLLENTLWGGPPQNPAGVTGTQYQTSSGSVTTGSASYSSFVQ